MNRLFAVLLVIVLLLVGVGFYRSWFAVSSPADPDGNKVNVSLTVDGDKVQEDAQAVQQRATELTGGLSGEETRSDERAADSVKPKNP